MVKNQYEYTFQRRKKINKILFKIILTIIVLFIIVQITFAFLIKPFHVMTNDMAPQLTKGEMVFVLSKGEDRPSIFNSKSINRGDIVILNSLKSKKTNFIANIGKRLFSFFTFEQYIPKDTKNMITSDDGLYRVVGMPGDSIYMNNYILYIKQKNDSHYLTEYEILTTNYNLEISQIPDDWLTDIGVPGDTQKTVLDENEYFLLCDYRVSGVDSRFFGPINSSRIAGKVICRYFPFDSIASF